MPRYDTQIVSWGVKLARDLFFVACTVSPAFPASPYRLHSRSQNGYTEINSNPTAFVVRRKLVNQLRTPGPRIVEICLINSESGAGFENPPATVDAGFWFRFLVSRTLGVPRARLQLWPAGTLF